MTEDLERAQEYGAMRGRIASGLERAKQAYQSACFEQRLHAIRRDAAYFRLSIVKPGDQRNQATIDHSKETAMAHASTDFADECIAIYRALGGNREDLFDVAIKGQRSAVEHEKGRAA